MGAGPPPGAGGGAAPRGGPKFVVTGSPFSSWNATFRLMSARDFGVPPYSRSFRSSSFRKTANFEFFSSSASACSGVSLRDKAAFAAVQQGAIEFRVRTEALPRIDVAVTLDHEVHVLDPFQRLLERVGKRDHAATRRRIDQRRHVPRHQVADAHRPQRREHHERVTVGVAGTEVIEVDAILALPERRLVGKRAVGHPRGVGLRIGHDPLLGVLVRHDLNHRSRGLEVVVAAVVIRVDVRVDDRRHRLVGDRLHLRQDRFAVVGQLGVNEDDPFGGDKHRRVTAGAADLVEALLDLLDRASRRNPRPGPPSAASALLRRDTGDCHAGHDDSGE